MNYGCRNCKYCKCYPGDYWTPDDFECSKAESGVLDISEENFDRCWSNDETWEDPENALCPDYEEEMTIEDEYWEKYNYEEKGE